MAKTLRGLFCGWAIFCSCVLGLAAEAKPKVALFFGDSITAGYGLDDPALAYPALLEKRAQEAGLNWRFVNAGLSGETTSGGLRRVGWVLRQHVDLFVLALGGNDGLRGLPPEVIRQNLVQILQRVRQDFPKAKLVLIGMRMPPEMGAAYTSAYAAAFAEAAKTAGVNFIPFLLEGVGGVRELNQADAIHPNVRGQQIIAEKLWPQIEPLLREP